MLAKWLEILPLFLVKWIAKRECERWLFRVGGTHYSFAMVSPEVLVLVKKECGLDSIGQHRPKETNERQLLRNTLIEAREMLESWGAYCPEFFQEKHGFAKDLAHLDRVLEATRPTD